MRSAWVFACYGSTVELLTLEEYNDRKGEHELLAVTRSLQEMCDLHAKYIGLAERRVMSEKELDRIAKALTSKKPREEVDLASLVQKGSL